MKFPKTKKKRRETQFENAKTQFENGKTQFTGDLLAWTGRAMRSKKALKWSVLKLLRVWLNHKGLQFSYVTEFTFKSESNNPFTWVEQWLIQIPDLHYRRYKNIENEVITTINYYLHFHSR